MKATQHPLDTRRRRAEGLLESRIGALFERLPPLCGFAVTQDLSLSEVAIASWPGYEAGRELDEEIMGTMAEIGVESPDALELLRGRTFARAFH